MVYYLACMVVLECLGLYFPMLLQQVTVVAQAQFNGNKEILPLVLQALLVLLFITLIFFVQFLAEFTGATYASKYQGKIRMALCNKFSRLSPEQIDEIGVARILPIIMNDTSWLRDFNRRCIILIVYFPIAILGSIIMLFNLSLIYALFALGTLPLVIGFFWLNMRRMKKYIPDAVEGYDNEFINVKEGIIGAKDIRILGKADERSADFERYAHAFRHQTLAQMRGKSLGQNFHQILFTLVTIVIIIFAVTFNLEPGETAGLVTLNTAIQYINKLWAGFNQIFDWFFVHWPRATYSTQRHERIYALPEVINEGGLENIPVYKHNHLDFTNVTLTQAKGKIEVDDLTLRVDDGEIVAVAGGLDSGKRAFTDMITKMRAPTEGTVSFNEIDLHQINTKYWRKEYLSICNNNPKFIIGTVRDNMKLFAPDVTDEQIMSVFKELGATNFVKKFENILDYQINENTDMTDGTRNTLNIVRAVLKPAHIYIFNQCFEHVQEEYIDHLMTLLKRMRKTAILVTYNASVCKHANKIYVLKHGKIAGSGTHAELVKSNASYRELHTSLGGVLVYEEEVRA